MAAPVAQIKILAQKDSTDQDAVFSGNFPFSLPLVPSAFSLSGNVTISGGIGTPLFETIEGLPDREGFSVYLALDGRGMLQVIAASPPPPLVSLELQLQVLY